MRIFHVVNISFVIPYFLGKQLLYFRQRGFEEYIVCSPSEELETFSKIYDFKYLKIDILRKISIWKDFLAIIRISRYIRDNKADVVTGHTPKGALLAMLASTLMRVPIRLYFRHGLVYETSTGLKRFMLIFMDRLSAKLATKVVCVSPSVYKRSLEDQLNPSHKQILLSKGTCNGIDIERFCRSNINENYLAQLSYNLGIKENNFIIGFSGRLVRDKGIIELIKAFKKIQQKNDNVILLLIGILEERDALPDEVVNSIKENVAIIHTGYVENSIIEYYYALMNVFILPSYREGFPTSVLEASAMELPIITTKATGCIDSIVEGETGIFVEHDVESIVNSIQLLYDNRNMCASYGKNGRNFVVENFNQYTIWQSIEKLYY